MRMALVDKPAPTHVLISSNLDSFLTTVGDEGGFAPPCDNREGCELIMEAISEAGYDGKCTIGLDVAASEFKVKGQDAYDLDFKYDGNIISGEELGNLYQSLAADFPIVTIEDPFDEVRFGLVALGGLAARLTFYFQHTHFLTSFAFAG